MLDIAKRFNIPFILLDKEQFLNVYNEATKEKFNFLFCQVDENRMLKNFDKELANEKDGVLIWNF